MCIMVVRFRIQMSTVMAHISISIVYSLVGVLEENDSVDFNKIVDVNTRLLI